MNNGNITELNSAVSIIPIELNAADSMSVSNILAVPIACDAFPNVRHIAMEV